jgi:hypothetical protein
MITSESVKSIAPAFLKAQEQMGAAKKGESNPFFKSKYADLSAVLEASKQALNENGISILQPHVTVFNPVTGEEVHFVETKLIHESGEFYSSRTKIVVAKDKDPQALGSAISYARRYGLQSLISLPAEDDDAENAMNRSTTSFSKKSSKVTPASKPSAQKFRKKKTEAITHEI